VHICKTEVEPAVRPRASDQFPPDQVFRLRALRSKLLSLLRPTERIRTSDLPFRRGLFFPLNYGEWFGVLKDFVRTGFSGYYVITSDLSLLPALAPVTFATSRAPRVPHERFELPQRGLENRCSSAELMRHCQQVKSRWLSIGTPPLPAPIPEGDLNLFAYA
jgi:hypothetical protein